MNEHAGMNIRAIAFDLDGTLVDSAGGVAHALNTALREYRWPAFDLPTVRSWIGDGPDVLIGHALRTLALPDDERGRLAPLLRRRFDAVTLQAPLTDSTVYPGIAALLELLHPQLPMVVVTNKPTALARAVLDAAGLLGRVAAVFGADSSALRKPSPGMLLQASAHLALAPAALLMVGDAAVDRQAAEAAGCPFAWAGWGYGHMPADDSLWRLGSPAQLLARLPIRERAASDH